MSNTPNVLEMEATIRKDPVKWARWKLKDQKGNPWQARWYQIDLINDVVQKKTNRLAVRMGRRVGKCLVGETLVEDADTGEMVRIDQIEKKGTKHVWSMDAKFKKVKGEIAHVWDNGIKDVFKVTTVSGKTITATENHPFYRNDGWTFVEELAPGDVVLVTGKGKQINAGKERMRLVNQGRLNENDRMHPNKSFVVDDMIHARMSGRPDSGERHYEEVSSIEYIGKRRTYDLTIKEYRNFEANGFMVHNTETMCIYMLWHAFHKKNQRLLVAAPYENQIRLIFKRLKELIATADELSQSLVKDTSNPYELAFSNGTAIIGFTVGATSGAGASVRGQRADFLFIDEIDYISRDGIDATIAISYENPREIGIWASSTPTGKRDFFYKICTNRTTGYKSYHYPSMVNPNFDANMEQEFRSTMTEQGYVHEVMAEFGEETMGVFGKKFVEAARDEFLYSYYPLNEYQRNIAIEDGYDLDKVVFMAEYTQKNLPPRAKRILGVDWDKKSVPFRSDPVDKMRVNCGEGLRALHTKRTRKRVRGAG